MARPLTKRFADLRAALELVFDQAARPLTVPEITEHSILKAEGFSNAEVASGLGRLLKLDTQPFPLKRILVGTGNNRWAWYNPTVAPQLEDRPRAPPEGATVVQERGAGDSKIDPPKPEPEFKFDPLPFAEEQQHAPTVDVPPEVKSITVRVGSVSIRIELDALADVR